MEHTQLAMKKLKRFFVVYRTMAFIYFIAMQ